MPHKTPHSRGMKLTARTKSAYGAWSSSYDSDRNPHIALEHPEVMKLVAPRKGEVILDAACGTGKYTSEFCIAGARVTGIDFSKKMLAIAAGRCPNANLALGNLSRKLPFPDRSFHKVNCAQALDHLPRLLNPMKEFARVLKPGGILVFSVTHPDMNWGGYVRKDGWSNRFRLTENADIFHRRFCDYFEAIERAGLAIDRIVQVPVSKEVQAHLTPKSYRAVKGRYQVVIFRLKKSSRRISCR